MEQKLNQVAVAGGQVAQVVRVAATAAAAQGMVPLSGDTLRAIQTAVDQSQDVLPPPEASPAGATATPTTTLEQSAQGPESTTGATQTSGTAPEQSTTTEGTTTEATTTTQAPTTTTSPPPEDTATPGSVGGGTGGAGDQAGAEERTPAEDVPQTTLAPPAT